MLRLLLLLLLVTVAGSQVRPQAPCATSFTGHPFGTCTVGDIALSGCPTGFDSIVWSTGYQGMWAQGLPVGDHSYQVYDNGSVVAADTLPVVQLAWSMQSVNLQPMGGGHTISGWVEVPWCNTSAFNAPCCIPDPALTYVRLVQDGTTEITTSPCVNCDLVSCSGTTFLFHNVPPGHSYQVRLYDLSCGAIMTDTNTFFVTLATGIADDAFDADPATLITTAADELVLPLSEGPFDEVVFFDALGRRAELPRTAPGRYSVRGLSPGIHIVRVHRAGRFRTLRFMRW